MSINDKLALREECVNFPAAKISFRLSESNHRLFLLEMVTSEKQSHNRAIQYHSSSFDGFKFQSSFVSKRKTVLQGIDVKRVG